MLEMIRDAVRAGESFGFETTLAGRGYANSIPRWRDSGYLVHLHFLSLPSAEMAIRRVEERVRQGGHGVPEAVIRRRFAKGLWNFEHVYRSIVTDWIRYDNGGATPRVIDQGENT